MTIKMIDNFLIILRTLKTWHLLGSINFICIKLYLSRVIHIEKKNGLIDMIVLYKSHKNE